MRQLAAGGAFGVLSATGLSTSITGTALGLLGLVSVGIAADKAHSNNGHHGQAVRLRLGLGARADMSGTGQKGNRGGGSEEHFDVRTDEDDRDYSVRERKRETRLVDLR